MVSSGSSDEATRVAYPILSEVEDRFKHNKMSALCYPMGLAAYFADQILNNGAEPADLIEEIRQNCIRRGEEQHASEFPQTLEVSIDALINNNFYMLLALEIKEARIYDTESFFEFMQTCSPEANQLGVTGISPRGRFTPARNLIPKEISM